MLLRVDETHGEMGEGTQHSGYSQGRGLYRNAPVICQQGRFGTKPKELLCIAAEVR